MLSKIFPTTEKRVFSDIENTEIYTACEKIRSDISDQTRGHKGIIDRPTFMLVCKSSLIDQFIVKKDWEKLFKEKDWLCLLTKLQNQNSFEKELIVIKKYFEKETIKYLNF